MGRRQRVENSSDLLPHEFAKPNFHKNGQKNTKFPPVK